MPYSQFTFAEARRQFSLTVQSDDLFAGLPAVASSAVFAGRVAVHADLAVSQGTEKARSELLVAPLLADLWYQSGRRLAVYSGAELNVDPARSLNGVCDFLVSHQPMVYPVEPPVLAVVEAKRDDIPSGYGQCTAAMVAGLELNRQQDTGREVIYGCSTTGTEWRFLRLHGTTLTIDTTLYSISDPARILGILLAICGFGPAPLHPRPDAQ